MTTKATRDVLDLSVRPVTKFVLTNTGDAIGPRRINATPIGGSVPEIGIFTNLQATTGTIGTLTNTNIRTSSATISNVLNVTGATIIGLNIDDRILSFSLSANYTAVPADRGKSFLCSGSFVFSMNASSVLGAGWFCHIKNVGSGSVSIDPNAAETIDGVASVSLAAGESCSIVSLGNGFYTLYHGEPFGAGGGGAVAPQQMVVQDQRTNGVSAASPAPVANTWTVRTIQTTQFNSIVGGSLVSNTITLPSGTYEVRGSAPFFRTDRAKIRLRNITDNVTYLIGTTAFSNSDQDADISTSVMDGVFTIGAAKQFQLQYFIQTVGHTGSLGVAVSSGEPEMYAKVSIWKQA